MSRLGRFMVTPALLRRLALASLAANVVIVVTGGAVRLTGSGLGCPTWPKCTDASYMTTRAMGVHGVIEYSNRMLGGVVGLIAIAALLAAVWLRPRRPALVGLAALVLAGVVGQGVLGGITVLTGLNPWTVAAHFLVSAGVIAAAYALWRRVDEADGAARPVVPGPLRALVWLLAAAAAAVLVLGTLVTGSGPHAGDPDTPRMGFDLTTIAQAHADVVFLLIGVSVATWFALRAVGAPPGAVRAAGALVGIELAQGLVGFVQYFMHVPPLAVGLHMLGACLVWLATLTLLYATRVREPLAAGPPTAVSAHSAGSSGGPSSGEVAAPVTEPEATLRVP
ncbi:MAG TPA: COX15/CtaA family protein [Micromonosporaceae bacterium]